MSGPARIPKASLAPSLVFRFRIGRVVAAAYRQYLRTTLNRFKADAATIKEARSKVKLLIRYNPACSRDEDLASDICDISNTIRQGIIQVHENPERGSWRLNIEREHFVNGTVEIPRIPSQSLFRAKHYVEKLFSGVQQRSSALEMSPENSDVFPKVVEATDYFASGTAVECSSNSPDSSSTRSN